MAGMSSRAIIIVLAVALAAAGVALFAVSIRAATAQPAQQTIYCRHGSGLPVGFEAGPGLPAGCPPGFRVVSG
jgi:hypothetical protein